MTISEQPYLHSRRPATGESSMPIPFVLDQKHGSQSEQSRLRAERRCSDLIGLAVVAMAGETGSDAIRKILGRHGVSAGY
jgi:hypothetical protein